MDIREGKEIQRFKGNEVQILSPAEVVDGMYSWADQVIVATNATRGRINHRMRQMLFNTEDPMPVIGDKLICLRNYWDEVNQIGDCLVNGSIGYVQGFNYEPNAFSNWLKGDLHIDFVTEDYLINGEFNPQLLEDPMFRNLRADYKLLSEGEPSVTKDNFRKFPALLRPMEFDYGYAITCWKSQGSEYDKVLLFEEGFPFTKEDHIKYLYTGATRASQKLVIIKKN
jgi:exodeoxyribonuclease-5